MIKTTYPPAFNEFWAELNKIKTRALGSKPEALQACKALKITLSDYPFLLDQYKEQKLEKEMLL